MNLCEADRLVRDELLAIGEVRLSIIESIKQIRDMGYSAEYLCEAVDTLREVEKNLHESIDILISETAKTYREN